MIDELISMFTRRPSPRERRALAMHTAARAKLASVSRSIRNGQRPNRDSTPTTDELIDDIEAARNNGLAALGGDK
jgi:hypothetical protein